MTRTLPQHLSPRRLTLAQRWTRILRSPFAEDLRAAWNSTLVWVGVATLGSLVFAVATRGAFLSWDGWQSIPAATGGVQ